MLEAVQAQVVVKANVADAAADDTVLAVGDTEREQAACVTVTSTGLRPGTVTVMVATLAEQVVLAVKLAVMVPLPVPEEGVTVHQVWLLTAVHAQVVVKLKFVDPADDGTA